MPHTKQDFAVLKECYKWAWVMTYGTSFYPQNCYDHPHHFHYFQAAPQSPVPNSQNHPPAIALPPRLVIDLFCGTDHKPPVLQKIREAGQSFIDYAQHGSNLKYLPLKELVLYYDTQGREIGLLAREHFLAQRSPQSL
jgi:hypothetical protein